MSFCTVYIYKSLWKTILFWALFKNDTLQTASPTNLTCSSILFNNLEVHTHTRLQEEKGRERCLRVQKA